jgi:hypothetical protein
MFTTLILTGLVSCTGGGTDSQTGTGIDDTGTSVTDDTSDTQVDTDSGEDPDPICDIFGTADTTIEAGEGPQGASGAVLEADGVPVFVLSEGLDSRLFTLRTIGVQDVVLFYTERAVGDVSPVDALEGVAPTCLVHDSPCENMTNVRLTLTQSEYLVEARAWPVPIWVVAMDAADAPTCSE